VKAFVAGIVAVCALGCGGSGSQLPVSRTLHVTLIPDSGRTQSMTFGPSTDGGAVIWFSGGAVTFDYLIGDEPGTVYFGGWDHEWPSDPGATEVWTQDLTLPGHQDASVTIDMTRLP
jgi:hypothetical protein